MVVTPQMSPFALMPLQLMVPQKRAFGDEAVVHHRPACLHRASPEVATRQRGELRLTRILLVLVLLADAPLRRVEPVLGVHASPPLEPELARAFGVEIGLDR